MDFQLSSSEYSENIIQEILAQRQVQKQEFFYH